MTNCDRSYQENFADGLETVHMLNGVVRLDLFTLEPGKGDEKPRPVVGERLIMPLSGLVQMYDTLTRVVDKLVEDGVLSRKPQETNNWDVQN